MRPIGKNPYLKVGNLSRQVLSSLLLRRLVGWRRFGQWFTRRAIQTVPVAAGAVGMGCIGFPYHPVWEITGACNLSCVHCHATSGLPGPNELTTGEGYRLIDQLAAERRFGMLVFTGGEPLVRQDLPDLLARSARRGLTNVIATNGTLIDAGVAKDLRRRNVRAAAISLDHTDPDRHNEIRRNPQAYQRAVAGMEACRQAGIALQVNFTAMPANRDNVAQMLKLCDELGASIVLCYQVVPMGRGAEMASLTAEQNRSLMEDIARLQADLLAVVEPVAAPQYWAQLWAAGAAADGNGQASRADGRAGRSMGMRVFHGCTAGWGLVYIKPDGEVWPCPFVPISGGNVRQRAFGEIWRHSPIFRDLRDRHNLKGRCGSCRYQSVCGGCRGKAFAACGDPLAEDPACFVGCPGEMAREKRP